MLKNIVCLLFLVGSLQLGWANIREKYSVDITNGNRNNVSIKSEPFININNGYYYFGMNGVNWYAAYEKCRELNSELVTFETLEEFLAVTRHLKAQNIKRDYWTSGNDLAHEGSYNWFTTGHSITIPKWAPNQPDNANGREHCIHLGYIYPYSTDFELNDRPCSNDPNSMFHYICEAPEMDTISIVVWK